MRNGPCSPFAAGSLSTRRRWSDAGPWCDLHHWPLAALSNLYGWTGDKFMFCVRPMAQRITGLTSSSFAGEELLGDSVDAAWPCRSLKLKLSVNDMKSEIWHRRAWHKELRVTSLRLAWTATFDITQAGIETIRELHLASLTFNITLCCRRERYLTSHRLAYIESYV